MNRNFTCVAVALAALLSGVAIGWQLHRHEIHRRIAPPLDDSVYRRMQVDFGDALVISRQSVNGAITHSIGGGTKSRPSTLQDIEDKTRRLAGYSTNVLVCVSINPNGSLHDLVELRNIVKRYGFRSVRMLVEYPPTNAGLANREFRELRLGPQRDLWWYQKEWYVENEMERANKMPGHIP